MPTTKSAPTLEPEPEPELDPPVVAAAATAAAITAAAAATASPKLNTYRLVVRKQMQVGSPEPRRYDIVNYWVEAPTQCSAAKHTALREEVDDISLIELWKHELPSDATITFSTTAECP